MTEERQGLDPAAGIRPSADGERLIAVFTALIEPLGRSLPPSSEVVLHDLSRLPNSIVAIHGEVTGRRVGDPATDHLLESLGGPGQDQAVGYETWLPDGRRIRSSTMIVRDVSGRPVAALCINSDLTVWESVRSLVDSMLGPEPPGAVEPPRQAPANPEFFATNVDELAEHLIRGAVDKVGVQVDLMQKKHKIAVVRDLRDRGMFLLRDAVEMVADRLQVTRFTIYNYLNEINDEDPSLQARPPRQARSRRPSGPNSEDAR